jgi:hypothetical protein
MALVLAYGIVLLVCVSLSGVATRTVLSTALLFLAAGGGDRSGRVAHRVHRTKRPYRCVAG